MCISFQYLNFLRASFQFNGYICALCICMIIKIFIIINTNRRAEMIYDFVFGKLFHPKKKTRADSFIFVVVFFYSHRRRIIIVGCWLTSHAKHLYPSICSVRLYVLCVKCVKCAPTTESTRRRASSTFWMPRSSSIGAERSWNTDNKQSNAVLIYIWPTNYYCLLGIKYAQATTYIYM